MMNNILYNLVPISKTLRNQSHSKTELWKTIKKTYNLINWVFIWAELNLKIIHFIRSIYTINEQVILRILKNLMFKCPKSVSSLNKMLRQIN